MTAGDHLSAFAITYAWIVNFGVAKITKHVRARPSELRDLGADVRGRHLVRLLRDDVRGLAAEARLRPRM